MLPLNGVAKYSKGQKGDSVPFTGYPRVHSSEKNKLILVNDPVGPSPTVLEFMLEDILFVEEIPSAVTEAGEGVPLVKLWVRRGAVGVILEPFEVNDSAQVSAKIRSIKENTRFTGESAGQKSSANNRPQAKNC